MQATDGSKILLIMKKVTACHVLSNLSVQDVDAVMVEFCPAVSWVCTMPLTINLYDIRQKMESGT